MPRRVPRHPNGSRRAAWFVSPLFPAVFGLASLLAACEQPAPPPPVVARWNGGQLLATELRAELDRLRRESSAEGRPTAADLDAIRLAAVDGLVEQRLLLAEAAARKVEVTDAQVDEALRRRHGKPQWTQRPSIGPVRPPAADDRPVPDKDELRRRTRDQLLVETLLMQEVVARVAVAPDEAQGVYDQFPDHFRRPERVRCAQVVVPTREEAEAVRRELQRGRTFSDLAKAHSTAPERARGGDLGWVEAGALPPALVDACLALRKGQVSEVVQTPYGFHLFSVTETKPGGVRPFAEVEAELERALRRDKVRDGQAAFVRKLRETAGVVVDAAQLGQVDWSAEPLGVRSESETSGEGRPSVDPPSDGVPEGGE